MSTFLYSCEIFGEFEREHSVHTILEICPLCEEKQLEAHKPKRLINCTSVGKVVLSGNDLTAKIKSDTQQLKRDMHKDERLYSNLVGNDKYEVLQTAIDKNKKA